MPERHPPVLIGVLVAVAAVSLTTVAIYPLREVAAVVSLGVVYLLAVLLVASVWGRWLGIATALASALAFNFFHIPPTGELTIATSENWVALTVFLIAAVATSALADTARTRAVEADERRREADLAAEMSRTLLRGDDLRGALPVAAQRLAASLELGSATIDLEPVDGDERQLAFPLREGSRQLGTLLVGRETPEPTLRRVRERIVPALEALLAAALERDALLSDVVETRALRRSDVLKTALLRAVSHDLRSPLTAIIAAAEPLAAPHVDDGDRRDLAGGIGQEAERLSRLIDDLLDLSRLEAHAAEPRPEWCSLDEVLRSAGDDVTTAGELSFSIDAELPLVRADAAQLERAFANLLENSARHAGGHPVSVRARAVTGRVLVRIVDRGPGIPTAQLERVFEPFYRAGDERTGHRGSGLGLAIARGFVEVNGGRVWAESLPGQGTSFVVELPLQAIPAPAPAAAT
ncbi:MAG: two-component system, OmpR family, sensor histidine kinase KdpD [Solirubrobacteraceae bacterium]|jgi:two-component system sensor histidine kinase KdpD|nr:two-component system, OmpR family, sensor histidine kinase KdpD [Solirubrobacteraceae bacterium]